MNSIIVMQNGERFRCLWEPQEVALECEKKIWLRVELDKQRPSYGGADSIWINTRLIALIIPVAGIVVESEEPQMKGGT